MASGNKGSRTNGSNTDRRLNAVSGGVLLIWIGIAMLFGFGWGTGLVVVGIILLGEQSVRWIYSVKFSKFWVIAGVVTVLSGILILFGVKVSLVPVLLIAFGVALLLSVRSGGGEEREA